MAPQPQSEEAHLTPAALAAELMALCPDGVSVDTLIQRSDTAGLDVQAVDSALDSLLEAAAVTVRRITPSKLHIMELSDLDSIRTRIKGSAYWVTASERRHYGGREYLLVREPENDADPLAVAVYGNGRKVGHVSAAKAGALFPLLQELEADAFRVTGAGASAQTTVLWVDVPKLDALRKHVRQMGGSAEK